MELSQKFLQGLLDEIKASNPDKITIEEVDAKLEKIDLDPEQNAEVYKYLEDNGVKVIYPIDTFDKDNSAKSEAKRS